MHYAYISLAVLCGLFLQVTAQARSDYSVNGQHNHVDQQQEYKNAYAYQNGYPQAYYQQEQNPTFIETVSRTVGDFFAPLFELDVTGVVLVMSATLIVLRLLGLIDLDSIIPPLQGVANSTEALREMYRGNRALNMSKLDNFERIIRMSTEIVKDWEDKYD